MSIYVLSVDNIRKRSGSEVRYLFGLVTRVLPGIVERSGHWSLHVSGDLSLLPDDAAAALNDAEAQHGRPAGARDARDRVRRSR